MYSLLGLFAILEPWCLSHGLPVLWAIELNAAHLESGLAEIQDKATTGGLNTLQSQVRIRETSRQDVLRGQIVTTPLVHSVPLALQFHHSTNDVCVLLQLLYIFMPLSKRVQGASSPQTELLEDMVPVAEHEINLMKLRHGLQIQSNSQQRTRNREYRLER
ncbi:hypothetical protein PENSPDRAFT_671632 [Peniophora sp. CONT]|nr:hypothetical protein PENSPDRAFT_671632 [Peniophora sp. CONT]